MGKVSDIYFHRFRPSPGVSFEPYGNHDRNMWMFIMGMIDTLDITGRLIK